MVIEHVVKIHSGRSEMRDRHGAIRDCHLAQKQAEEGNTGRPFLSEDKKSPHLQRETNHIIATLNVAGFDWPVFCRDHALEPLVSAVLDGFRC